MRARWAAGLLCYVEELCLLERGEPAAEVLVPLMKVQASRLGTWTVRQAQLIFAGHGILRDFSILPRLADDAFIQEIWEGTHGVLAQHAAKALRRPASREAFLALLDSCAKGAAKRKGAAGGLELLGEARHRLGKALERAAEAAPEERDALALELCDQAYACLSLALRLREAGGPLDAAGALGPIDGLIGLFPTENCPHPPSTRFARSGTFSRRREKEKHRWLVYQHPAN
jgi:putative acyl-CoA dehydrogenase